MKEFIPFDRQSGRSDVRVSKQAAGGRDTKVKGVAKERDCRIEGLEGSEGATDAATRAFGNASTRGETRCDDIYGIYWILATASRDGGVSCRRRDPRRGSRFADVANRRYAAYDLRNVSKQNRVDVFVLA